MSIHPEIGWVRTAGCLVIVYKKQPIKLTTGTYKFQKALKLIATKKINKLIDYIFPKKRIEKFTKSKFTVKETKERKLIIIDKKTKVKMADVIAKKLLEFADNDYPFTAINNFWKNLQKNPDKNSIEQLYSYLEHYKFPILKDGTFLAYKYVTLVTKKIHDNWRGTNCKWKIKKFSIGSLVDYYSLSNSKVQYLNNPGCIVAMDRKKCDSNPNNECSDGLHVAAWQYAYKWGSGDTVVVIKVNPKDVVSVPKDYQFQKMRTCRYEVLAKGKKEVDKTYVTASFIAGEVKGELNEDDLKKMTAQQLKDSAHEKYGVDIQTSNKNKQSIIKQILKISKEKKLSAIKKVDLRDMTAKQIIDEVFCQTGENIRLSLKNKKSIVKKTVKILNSHGLEVII